MDLFYDDINKFYSSKFRITENNFIEIESNDISFNDPIIKQLIDKYKSLSVNCNILLKNIPKNIVKLALIFQDYTNVEVNNLPEGLKELYILCGQVPYGGENNHFNNRINNLPQGLEKLVIQSHIFNQSLDFLPYNLKYLFIVSNKFNNSLDNLPVNLEILYLKILNYNDINKYNCTIYNLPYNLKQFIVSNNFLINTNINELKKHNSRLNIITFGNISNPPKLDFVYPYKESFIYGMVYGMFIGCLSFVIGYKMNDIITYIIPRL